MHIYRTKLSRKHLGEYEYYIVYTRSTDSWAARTKFLEMARRHDMTLLTVERFNDRPGHHELDTLIPIANRWC